MEMSSNLLMNDNLDVDDSYRLMPTSIVSSDAELDVFANTMDAQHESEIDVTVESHSWKSKILKVHAISVKPLRVFYSYTNISCEHDGPNAKYYLIAFFLAFIWVSASSFVVGVVAGRWYDSTGLPMSLFGIVLVAVGAEIPDTISSTTVARRGYGSMAVSNSCGSQITNILFGLGVPFFISTAQAKAAGETVSPVYLAEYKEILIAIGFQLGNICLFLLIMFGETIYHHFDKVHLTKKKGLIMSIIYACVVVGYCITVFAVDPSVDEEDET
jgi:Ca2+/Na+ antiporter